MASNISFCLAIVWDCCSWIDSNKLKLGIWVFFEDLFMIEECNEWAWLKAGRPVKFDGSTKLLLIPILLIV